MKIGKGAIIGLIGGLLGLIGVFLPWVTASATIGPLTVTMSVPGSCLGGIGSVDVMGFSVPCSQAASGEGAIYAYGILVLSVLGLIFVLLGKRSTAMLALIFGLLVLVLGAVAAARLSAVLGGVPPGMSVGLGYGLILSIVGGVLLLLGGVMAMGEAKKAAMAPPPMPMPMGPAPPPPS